MLTSGAVRLSSGRQKMLVTGRQKMLVIELVYIVSTADYGRCFQEVIYGSY